MRIVQVCPYDPDRHGGVQRNMHALAGELGSRGHQTLIIAPGAAVAGQQGVWRLGGMKAGRCTMVMSVWDRFRLA